MLPLRSFLGNPACIEQKEEKKKTIGVVLCTAMHFCKIFCLTHDVSPAAVSTDTAAAAAASAATATGLFCVIMAEVSECFRLIMTQLLLTDHKFHIVDALLYIVPAGAVWLTLGSAVFEWPTMAKEGRFPAFPLSRVSFSGVPSFLASGTLLASPPAAGAAFPPRVHLLVFPSSGMLFQANECSDSKYCVATLNSALQNMPQTRASYADH